MENVNSNLKDEKSPCDLLLKFGPEICLATNRSEYIMQLLKTRQVNRKNDSDNSKKYTKENNDCKNITSIDCSKILQKEKFDLEDQEPIIKGIFN